MSTKDASNSLFPIPTTTKQPIPPPYRGLPDAATFGRLASRPDRINEEARAFFASWLEDVGVAFRRPDGSLVLHSEFVPIGASSLVSVDVLPSTTPEAAVPAVAASAKKPSAASTK